MTVATELALTSQRIEYIVCIEGVGWPTNEASLASGFDGDVFVTGDLDGDLASKLGCTIHETISALSNVSDSVDPITAETMPSPFNFTIADKDSFLRGAYRPRASGVVDTLQTDLKYGVEDVVTDDGTHAAGDVVWIAGSEAVLLGTKSGAGPYTYSSSTRGYLGTRRGSVDRFPRNSGAFSWEDGVTVYGAHRFWNDRRVVLYMHVPGEAVSNCQEIWRGRLRSISQSITGHMFKIGCVGDIAMWTNRIRTGYTLDVQGNSVQWNIDTLGDVNRVANQGPYDPSHTTRLVSGAVQRWFTLSPSANDGSITSANRNQYALASAYVYRTEPGGTKGMKSTWDSGSVQAADIGSDNDVIMSYLSIKGDGVSEVLLCKKRATDHDGSSFSPYKVTAEIFSSAGTSEGSVSRVSEGLDAVWSAYDGEIKGRFLLDNIQEQTAFNRFTVNGSIRRHPIDVLLCFLTSMDDEYYIADSTVNSTTTSIELASAASDSANIFDGAAIFCVEGTSKGESRIINAQSATDTFDVDEAFTGATPYTNNEFQVRNSVYDVLPWGWGLGVPFWAIDIDSFEDIRDKQMPGAELGKFIIGTEDRIDLLEFIKGNILEPYGIQMYVSKTNGKITARLITPVETDDDLSSAVAVVEADILDATIPSFNENLVNQISRGEIACRKTFNYAVDVVIEEWKNNWDSLVTIDTVKKVSPDLLVAKGKEIVPVRLTEAEASVHDYMAGSLEVRAMLNDTENIEYLSARVLGLIRQRNACPPVVDIELASKHTTTVQAGQIIRITWATNPIDPYSTSSGWSNQLARVLSSEVMINNGPGIRCTVELMDSKNLALVAPACLVDGAFRGADGGGSDHYIIVKPTEYLSNLQTALSTGSKDYYNFAVGDLIEVRDADGTVNEGSLSIQAFGQNASSDPSDADTDWIRVNETLSGTYFATSYVTFQHWSGSNTSNMDDYSAYADASGALTGGDTPKRYS